MSNGLVIDGRKQLSVPRSDQAWTIVAARELRDLWVGGRGPVLVLIFSILLSVVTYLTAANKELNLIDQKDSVNLIMKLTTGIGVALSLLVNADALSGERERGTLESLLLTPLSPRQLAMGKLIAGLSVWPVVVLVAAPYVWVLRTDYRIVFDAISAGFVVGLMLVAAFGSLGIVVSTLSSSNRVSIAASFFIFVVLMAPSQLPGGLPSGWLGDLLTRINPVSSATAFLDRVVVRNHAWSQEADLLTAPFVAALIGLGAAMVISSRLRLQGGIGK